MSPRADQSVNPRDDQATRLRELVARLDRARDGAEAAAARTAPRARRGADGRSTPSPVVRSAHVIAIASGKGGVGKTSISVNLSAALAQLGSRVILLDGDFGLANADLLCGVRVTTHLGHVIDGSRELSEALVPTEAGFRLAPGASGLSTLLRAPVADRRRLVARLASLDESCDVVVIDCGAGMGDGVLAFLRTADLALIVTTPEPTAIADAYALIKTMVRTPTEWGHGASTPRLVVNMCDDERDADRAHHRMTSVAERFLGASVPMAGWAPRDSNVADAVRARSPFVRRTPHADASRAMVRLARDLDREFGLHAAPSRRSGGFWRRLCGLPGLNRRERGQAD